MLLRIWTGVGSHISSNNSNKDCILHQSKCHFIAKTRAFECLCSAEIVKHSHFGALFLSSGLLMDFSLMLLLLSIYHESWIRINVNFVY